jgi:hypothetical protein
VNPEVLNWVFYGMVVISLCCSATGYVTAERGWYVLAACLAAGALIAAVALATVESPGTA